MNRIKIVYLITFLVFAGVAMTTYMRTSTGYFENPIWIMMNDVLKYILFGIVGGLVLKKVIKMR